jgi:NTP pyrophosphatase (non-canonical NTP hydrolase)
MDFDEYQQLAVRTRQTPASADVPSVVVSLLGLAGEAGQLLSEYKKSIRDGPAHKLHRERVAEELGDLLWYVANVAEQFDLKLDRVAGENLRKTDERWGSGRLPSVEQGTPSAFDVHYSASEQLPRKGIAEIRPVLGDRTKRIETYVNIQKMGDNLTDNAWTEDGYRLHDVFHLACMTLLGWSPVIRRGLGIKRRSDKGVDEVEDGGRAIVIEEGVSALVFSYALRHEMLLGIHTLDYSLLRTIKQMTDHLEVRARTVADWERTIICAYEVWRAIAEYEGGRIEFDADQLRFTFAGPLEPLSALPQVPLEDLPHL